MALRRLGTKPPMNLFGLKVQSLRVQVPKPIVFYALLGVLDLGFTLIAFQLGYREGNPVLNWFASHGLFEVAKISLTVSVVLIGFLLWERRVVRSVVAVANVVMAGVVAFHLVNLGALLLS